MSFEPSEPPLVPDVHTPRTFGILNVVFALMIIPCGLSLGMCEMIPVLVGYVSDREIQKEQRQREIQKSELERLDKEIQAAKNEDERARLTKNKTAQLSLTIQSPDVPKVFANPDFRDPAYVAHFAGDIASALILNLLLLIAGAGLIYQKEWARVLAIVVCWGKLIRLVLLSLSAYFVIAPWVSRVVTMLENQAVSLDATLAVSNPRAGPDVAMLVRVIAMTVLVFGSIYPIFQIWFLARPSVRLACKPRSR